MQLNWISIRHEISMKKGQIPVDFIVYILQLQLKKLNADHFINIHTNVIIYISLNNL